MPSLTVKNIPKELCERLKKSAAGNRRSLNQEVIVCLERAVVDAAVKPGELLSRVRALRERNRRIFVTDKVLREAKNTGRP